MDWESVGKVATLVVPLVGGVIATIGGVIGIRVGLWKLRVETANDLQAKAEKHVAMAKAEIAELEKANGKKLAELNREYQRLVEENQELRTKLGLAEWTPGPENPFFTGHIQC